MNCPVSSLGSHGDAELDAPCGVPCESRPLGRMTTDITLAIVNSRTPFSCFARRFLCEKPVELLGRIQDMFPLPRLSDLSAFELPHSLVLLAPSFVIYCSLAFAGLAYMSGEQNVTTARKPTELQLAVQQRVVWKSNRLLEHVDKHFPAGAPLSFGSFVGRGDTSKYSGMCAGAVDGFPQCGLVEPMHFLAVATPSIMFPSGVKAVGLRATISGKDCAEYIRLLIRHLRSGKVQLSAHARANAPVFTIGKSGGRRQREIWTGNEVSELAEKLSRTSVFDLPSSVSACGNC